MFSFSGQIFTSSQFSLPNDSLKFNTYKGIFSDSSKAIGNSITYDVSLGGNDGTSLSKIGNIWTSGLPTPGAENETSSTPPPADDSNNEGDSSSGGSSSDSSTSSSSTTETKTKTITAVSKIKAQITTKALAYVGIPLAFQGMAFGSQGEQLFRGRYFWNFGDGDFREVNVINTDKFFHTYFYPGEYTVLFEYYPNFFADVPDATDKVIIKVVVPEILISKVGDEKDFFVELSNNTGYDIDISKWILSGNGKSFIIPLNTIIGSKKKIIISSKITNFSVADKNTLKLLNPQGELIFDYSLSLLPAETVLALPIENTVSSTTRVKSLKSKETVLTQSTPEEINTENIEEINPLENLSASPSLSDVVQEGADNSYIPIIIFFALLATSAGAVYFLRQKKIKKNIMSSVGSDFEILDE